MRISSLAPGIVLIGALLLSLTGCTTPESKRDALLKRLGPPQPPLKAEAGLLDGTLGVVVTLDPAFAGGLGAAGQRDLPGGMKSRPGGAKMRRAAASGQLTPEMMARLQQQAGGTLVRPVQKILGVELTNRGEATLEFSVTEVRSLLGNFGIRPERLALAPGQSATLEPMGSNIPDRFERLEVTLAVRTRDRTDQRVLELTPVAGSASPSEEP